MINKEFLKLIFKRKYKIIIAILLVIIFSATEVFANYSMSFFMDIIDVKDKKDFIFVLIKITGIVIGANVLWVLVMYVQERYKNILRKDFRNDIKSHIVDKINSLSYQELKSNDSGTFISWLSVDIQQISQSSYGNFFSIITEFLKYSISIISILYINIFAGIISIILSIFMMVFPPFLNRIMENISKNRTIANEKFLSDSKNYISGYDIFVLTNLKKVFKEKILISSEELENVEFKFRAKFIFVHCLRVLVLILPLLIMFVVAGYSVYKNSLPTHQFLGIQQLAVVSFNSLSTLFLEFTEFNTTAPIFDKYIVDKKSENREERIDKLEDILVDDITFAYDEDKYILKNYSARFEFPNKYFLVGKSGGGKSTLVKLLQGLYKVNDGKIYLNGKNVDSIKLEDIRNNMGYLSQDIYLFNASIRENITLWQDYSDEKIWEILKICQIDDFIRNLPDGLDTQILENAKNISGGQKQRIGLARLLIRKLRFLIIDEGTSQLDKENREKIEEILLGLKDVSVLIITHNLNKKTQDCIVVNV